MEAFLFFNMFASFLLGHGFTRFSCSLSGKHWAWSLSLGIGFTTSWLRSSIHSFHDCPLALMPSVV